MVTIVKRVDEGKNTMRTKEDVKGDYYIKGRDLT